MVQVTSLDMDQTRTGGLSGDHSWGLAVGDWQWGIGSGNGNLLRGDANGTGERGRNTNYYHE